MMGSLLNIRGHFLSLTPARVLRRRNSRLHVSTPAEVNTKFIAEAGNLASLQDLFSMPMFLSVIHDPIAAKQLLIFTRQRFCSQNLEFFENLEILLDSVLGTMAEIIQQNLSNSSQGCDILPEIMLDELQGILKDAISTQIPALKANLVDSKAFVQSVLYADVYQRFVLQQITKNVAEAFKEERSPYKGSGDCFCMTNPLLVDNPITYASDGFVAVTGYDRSEVIGRNCRFLQGEDTSQSSRARIRISIDNSEEIVELLTNYQKNGEVFWNLVYIAPLYNDHRKVQFFIGGQIDCTTSIQSQPKLLQVLASPEVLPGVVSIPKPTNREGNSQEQNYPNQPILDLTNEIQISQGEATLSSMKWMNLEEQVNKFYMYAVVSYPDLKVRFISSSMAQLLCPLSQDPSTFVFSKKIFVVLITALGFDVEYLKESVKEALAKGVAVSPAVDIRKGWEGTSKDIDKEETLAIGRDTWKAKKRVFEQRSITMHWTPMKDQGGKTKWVVQSFSL